MFYTLNYLEMQFFESVRNRNTALQFLKRASHSFVAGFVVQAGDVGLPLFLIHPENAMGLVLVDRDKYAVNSLWRWQALHHPLA